MNIYDPMVTLKREMPIKGYWEEITIIESWHTEQQQRHDTQNNNGAITEPWHTEQQQSNNWAMTHRTTTEQQ